MRETSQGGEEKTFMLVLGKSYAQLCISKREGLKMYLSSALCTIKFNALCTLTFSVKKRLLDVIGGEGRQQHLE